MVTTEQQLEQARADLAAMTTERDQAQAAVGAVTAERDKAIEWRDQAKADRDKLADELAALGSPNIAGGSTSSIGAAPPTEET